MPAPKTSAITAPACPSDRQLQIERLYRTLDGESVDTPLLQVRVGGERYRFRPGRPQLVYMLDSDSTKQTLWMYDVVTQKTLQLSDFDMPGTRTFDITPDGTRIVFDRLRENSDIVLIDRHATTAR